MAPSKPTHSPETQITPSHSSLKSLKMQVTPMPPPPPQHCMDNTAWITRKKLAYINPHSFSSGELVLTKKMEVETRISVQAIRGKFEQLPEDNSFPFIPSTTPRLSSTSPGRPRASSLIFKENDGYCSNAKEVTKTTHSFPNKNPLNKSSKQLSDSVSKAKSVIADFTSPVITSSLVVKGLSSKKHSVDSCKDRKLCLETQQHEGVSYSVGCSPSRKILESNVAETKANVVRRIPVFKSFSGGISSDENAIDKLEMKIPVGETECKKEKKFLGHIRSRSHGNFIIKRDASVERNCGFSNKSDTGKSGKENSTYLLKNLRQKSSDNLYSFRDSKCSSPFEGKQKIVASVVKNMKNKEIPNVLRKLSFSSKTEKEVKMQPDTAKDASAYKTDSSMISKIAKMEAVAKSTVSERKSSVTGAGTVSVARAVADIAMVKSANRSPNLSIDMQTFSDEALNGSFSKSPKISNKSESACDEISPPARPPRRRSANYGLSSHKKGMAPSPPGQQPLFQNNFEKEYFIENRSCDKHSLSEKGQSPDIVRNRYQDSPDYSRSSDSLASPMLSDISGENSPVVTPQQFPAIIRNNSESSLTLSDVGKSPSEHDTRDSKIVLGNESFVSLERTEPVHTPIKNSSDQYDLEILPLGPPPKKPPRTFAYDIYKSSKESKSDENTFPKTDENSTEKIEPGSPTNRGPVYAVPLKKKKSDNGLTLKAPVRSNSDLSKKDLVKPSVAPKPSHIISRVKRSSVIDPLPTTEKSKEKSLASEFQRQAHIRYSLRRPKKPPPAPPPDSEIGHDSITDVSLPKSTVFTQCSTSLNMKDAASKESNILYDLSDSNLRLHSSNTPNGAYQSIDSSSEDGNSPLPTLRITSHSSYNLSVPSAVEDSQPLSLGHCPVDSLSPNLAGIYRKRSMSDETLYKGSRCGDEPIYAMPIFANNKGTRGHNRQRELHYMEADAGRDGGRKLNRNAESTDVGKVKPSIISAWKREFRQSCRQVQNKIKKTVNR
ncbi:hypothetical protein SK128_025702 [Halocaridina rubra]|uniref:Uncharacterized protein n=1 Tax=Halocaridina rubra TaxID=373956 RepID=A0AAN8X1M8_HALRR